MPAGGLPSQTLSRSPGASRPRMRSWQSGGIGPGQSRVADFVPDESSFQGQLWDGRVKIQCRHCNDSVTTRLRNKPDYLEAISILVMAATVRGKEKKNVVPWPGSLFTPTEPPCAWTI